MMKRFYCVFSILLALLILAGAGCSGMSGIISARGKNQSFEWPVSTLEEQDFNSKLIDEMLQEIDEKDIAIESVLLVRHGFIVSETYFSGNTNRTRFPLYSITKSVTSAMTGIAIQEGYIQSVDQKVLGFFPEIADATNDEWLQALTIENLLTMTTGYQANTLPDLNSQPRDFDTAAHILTDSPIIVEPGTEFFYNNAAPHLMSIILQQQSGMTLEEYTQQALFEPLDIEQYRWKKTRQGNTTGNTGLELRARDMAKLGYLYLHQGKWNDEQVVPAGWVADSTHMHIETHGLMNEAEDNGYGYFWWVDDFGGFSAHGYAGQYIFVLPDADMVVVFTSSLAEKDFPVPYNLLKTYILPSVETE